MRFVNFKIPADRLAAELSRLQAGFAASGKAGSFEENAARVIGARLRARPQAYLEFGPYWWAIKMALNDAGQAWGDRGDPLVAMEYRGDSVAATLVAGELFADMARAMYFVGHSAWDLADDGEVYELFDPDMEARVPLPAG